MTIVHTVPTIAIFTNLIITQIVFLKRDWRLCFTAGIAYIFADWLGTMNEGHPMYPVVDWKNPSVTIAIFVIQAYMLACINLIVSTVLQHCRKFNEGTGQNIGECKEWDLPLELLHYSSFSLEIASKIINFYKKVKIFCYIYTIFYFLKLEI